MGYMNLSNIAIGAEHTTPAVKHPDRQPTKKMTKKKNKTKYKKAPQAPR
jgi:hypothetical protein